MILSAEPTAESWKSARYFLHGMTVFDSEGQPIERVWTIDTDTMVCRLGGVDGRCVIAAGFCFIAGSRDYYDLMRYHIPSGLMPFVVKMPEGEYPDEDQRAELCRQWVADYLHRVPAAPPRPRYDPVETSAAAI